MRLAPRLVLTFGLLAAVSTAGLGFALRESRRQDETKRFDDAVRSACARVTSEVGRQLEADKKLLAGACRSGELVDRTLIYASRSELDLHRSALASLVKDERDAFGFDALLLATTDGDLLGADPRALLSLTSSDVRALATTDESRVLDGRGPISGLVVRCARGDKNGRGIALVGSRDLPALVLRLGQTAGVTARVLAPPDGSPRAASEENAEASCSFEAGGAPPSARTITVTMPKTELERSLARVDETVRYAVLIACGIALLVAMLLARSLGAPLGELAAQARRVASGEARPIRVKRSGEIGDLVVAFDTMLLDLAVTRRRLAATTRVAAWREVARRVAHEVKNPLAPIRAAVETLRRLRARGDPEFDGYFDEATRTVLDEVHRIAAIVTEFTRFARLPPPRPEEVDLREVVEKVVSLLRTVSEGIPLTVEGATRAVVSADADQVVQVLTNLVKNAVEAIRGGGGEGAVRVLVKREAEAGEPRVVIDVIDDGPGLSPEIAPRLFEPYATSKADGTGLGLAIAQRIAIEHGGELSYVPPEQGEQGAHFRFVLPVSGPPPPSEMAPPSQDA